MLLLCQIFWELRTSNYCYKVSRTCPRSLHTWLLAPLWFMLPGLCCYVQTTAPKHLCSLAHVYVRSLGLILVSSDFGFCDTLFVHHLFLFPFPILPDGFVPVPDCVTFIKHLFTAHAS